MLYQAEPHRHAHERPTRHLRSTQPTLSIAQRMKSSEPWLLISGGNCSEADPLTILGIDNHVALENFIAQLLMEEELG